jgi:hypothetical protein
VVATRFVGAGGGSVKEPRLVDVPDGVVTLMVPVVAPAGAVAVIWVSELTLKVALTPLNFTDVAPVKLVPVIVTEVPGVPLVGLKLVMLGSTLKPEALKAVPAGLVTLISPEVAPPGTVDVI